jgi:hypothetical protein
VRDHFTELAQSRQLEGGRCYCDKGQSLDVTTEADDMAVGETEGRGSTLSPTDADRGICLARTVPGWQRVLDGHAARSCSPARPHGDGRGQPWPDERPGQQDWPQARPRPGTARARVVTAGSG